MEEAGLAWEEIRLGLFLSEEMAGLYEEPAEAPVNPYGDIN